MDCITGPSLNEVVKLAIIRLQEPVVGLPVAPYAMAVRRRPGLDNKKATRNILRRQISRQLGEPGAANSYQGLDALAELLHADQEG
jgi:hypothetical protein